MYFTNCVLFFQCRENMQEIHEVHVERLIGQQMKDKSVLEKSHSKNLKRASKEGQDINMVQRQNHEEFVRFTAEQEQKVCYVMFNHLCNILQFLQQ